MLPKFRFNSFNNKVLLFIAFLAAGVLTISVTGLSEYVLVHAAPLTQAMMRLDRMKTSTSPVNILIVARPASTATENEVRVAFSSSFSVNSTASNITISTANLPSELVGAQTCYAMLTTSSVAAAVSGTTVDFSVANLDTTTTYCFFITQGVGIGTTIPAAQYLHTIGTLSVGDTAVDTSTVATRVISDDQVTVTAIVPPTFNFTLGANSTSFQTDLSTSQVTSATAVTVTLATNAPNGWVAWLKSTSGALGSATTGESILTSGAIDNAPMTLINGRDMYMLDVNVNTDSSTGDGTVSVDGEYDGAASQGGAYSSTALERIAHASGTSDGDIIDLVAKATLSAVRSAATDYTDLWTVVGAAEF
jgi:hypothetical protein